MIRPSIAVLLLMLLQAPAAAQVSVEVLTTTGRTSVDVMFFQFFRNGEGGTSEILFFNRNRALYDHGAAGGARQPQFGFTEALSWNPPALGGFAPVGVAQILSSGAQVKAGIQFAQVSKTWTVFSWVVSELRAHPALDAYALVRHVMEIDDAWRVNLQAEALHAFATDATASHVFTQRLRVGLQRWGAVAGIGIDLQQRGRGTMSTSEHFGVFVRYVFASP